jgi:hypothetical protein
MTLVSIERDLYCAIGRVASESANTEEILRSALRGYSMDDAITVVFEGQSFDQLADSIRAIFKFALDALLESHPEYILAQRNFETVNNALVSMRPLRDRRNLIIHGTWSICQSGKDCPAGFLQSICDEVPVFHFSRSRSRRDVKSEEHLTVSGVEKLADSIKEQNDSLSHVVLGVRPKMWV